jgi:malate dehydrogenase
VIRLKGATVYAPGNAVATMTEAIIKDKKSVIPLSAYLEGEFGVNDVCIGVPAVVGKDGIEKIVELPLNDFERQEFEKGIQNVREAISSLPL